MRDIVLRYIIVHLFMNSCNPAMGNQATQIEFHQQQQQLQPRRPPATQLRDQRRPARAASGGGSNGHQSLAGGGHGGGDDDRYPTDQRTAVATAASFITTLSLIPSPAANASVPTEAPPPPPSPPPSPASVNRPEESPGSHDLPSSGDDIDTAAGNKYATVKPSRIHADLPHPWPTLSAHIRPQLPVTNATTMPVATTTTSTTNTANATTPSTPPGLVDMLPLVGTMPTLVRDQHQQQQQQQHHHHKSAAQSAAQENRLPKIQRTDAPIHNHIFDGGSPTIQKHHHYHDHRYGPHFEDIYSDGNVTNITVQVGSTVYLNCRISLLQDKTVSWVRRKSGDANLDLLTVGKHTYSGDPRYKIEFQYPDNWRLKLEAAVKDDEGTYECQISTHPPRIIQKNVFVNDPKVLIIDETGVALQDKYYEVDSTMQLSCIVRHVAMKSAVVLWSHGDQVLNYDTQRGGVSVKTEIMEKGANSTLFVAKINKSDSGNYTCSINSSHDFTVLVHVLNGESFAELHHGGSRSGRLIGTETVLLLITLVGLHWAAAATLATMATVARLLSGGHRQPAKDAADKQQRKAAEAAGAASCAVRAEKGATAVAVEMTATKAAPVAQLAIGRR